jgi:hypothetical protein
MPPFTSEYTFDDSKSCSSAEPQAPMKNESCYAPVGRRSVTFATTVAVLEVQHLKDTTNAEIAASWYDNSECEAIKKRMVATIRLMMAKKPIGSDQCTRGLEFRTPSGAKLRKKNKLESLTAVWNEQVSQWKTGTSDAEAISRVYIETSKHCGEKAQKAGAYDAKVVQKYSGLSRNGSEDHSQNSLRLGGKLEAESKARREIVGDDLKQQVGSDHQRQPRRTSCGPAAA